MNGEKTIGGKRNEASGGDENMIRPPDLNSPHFFKSHIEPLRLIGDALSKAKELENIDSNDFSKYDEAYCFAAKWLLAWLKEWEAENKNNGANENER